MRYLPLLLVLSACAPGATSEPPASTVNVEPAGEHPQPSAHECSVEIWYTGPESHDGAASGASRQEAEQAACKRACEALENSTGADCNDERAYRRLTEPGEARGPKTFDAVCRYYLRDRKRHAASSTASFADACRKAHAEVCEMRDCAHGSLVAVGGLDLAELPELLRKPDSPIANAQQGEHTCQLGVRLTLRSATGNAQSTKPGDDLRARARADACRGLGLTADDCANPDRVRQPSIRTSMRFSGGTMESEVTVELALVERAEAAARGPTRRAACRAAVARLCGAGACAKAAPMLVSIDGIEPHTAEALVRRPPFDLFGRPSQPTP